MGRPPAAADPSAAAGAAGPDVPLGWSPAPRPVRLALAGARVSLEPLDPPAHAAALYEASRGAGAEHLWDFLAVGPFEAADQFDAWLESVAALDDPLFYAIVPQASSLPAGMCSYLRITPEHGVIEIGNIWFSPGLQRTAAASEAIYLLARHAFDTLGYRRLEWKCDALNAPSRRAALRFGFSFEGVFRQHMVVKGRNRDTAWYALLDGEWPQARSAFERWLAEENFDADGVQRATLAELRSQPPAQEARR